MGGALPNFGAVGSLLSRYGITGITDMSPANNTATAAHFSNQHRAALPQRVHLAGTQGLRAGDSEITLGPLKIHLHEANLPDYDATVAAIRTAHAASRPVAVHCVTEVELVFTLAALREAGTIPGDRIEHASIAPDSLIEDIAALNLIVCVQPHFVTERGDAYRADIPEPEWKNLYRLRAFHNAGIPIIGGSDTPYGAADPWAAMQAATTRRTASGESLGESEGLTPEEALNLFLADPSDLTRSSRIEPGAQADLCLLQKPWAESCKNLTADHVRATFINGALVHHRVD
jgi:predicted amidohydrolase YtcJ